MLRSCLPCFRRKGRAVCELKPRDGLLRRRECRAREIGQPLAYWRRPSTVEVRESRSRLLVAFAVMCNEFSSDVTGYSTGCGGPPGTFELKAGRVESRRDCRVPEPGR